MTIYNASRKTYNLNRIIVTPYTYYIVYIGGSVDSSNSPLYVLSFRPVIYWLFSPYPYVHLYALTCCTGNPFLTTVFKILFFKKQETLRGGFTPQFWGFGRRKKRDHVTEISAHDNNI